MTNGQEKRLIWLASYPKSGNTWVRLALCSMRAGGAPIVLDDILRFAIMPTRRRLFDELLEVESGSLTRAEIDALRPAFHDAIAATDPELRLLKIHDRWYRTRAGRPVFDQAHTRGAIYIIRDPRDVAISWARFSNQTVDWGIGNLANPESRLNASNIKIAPNIAQWLGHWSNHVTTWVDESGLAPLVVRYEDMHADPVSTLARMATYLGWEVTPDAVTGAIAASAFDRMADQERRTGFAEMPDTAAQFFVSGRAGGWRDVLSAEQAARIERDHETVMRRFGYL